jgi:hypothetical protein
MEETRSNATTEFDEKQTQRGAGKVKGVEHLSAVIADADGQPNVNKAMENLENQMSENESEVERVIRESERRFMLTEIPLNLAIKKIQNIESQMPLLDGIMLRLDHYATMIQAHDDQLRYTADKRDLAIRIDDVKDNQEARIRAHFIETA